MVNPVLWLTSSLPARLRIAALVCVAMFVWASWAFSGELAEREKAELRSQLEKALRHEQSLPVLEQIVWKAGNSQEKEFIPLLKGIASEY